MTGQVLQRDENGKGGAIISGSCKGSGDVEYRILKNSKVYKGSKWQLGGRAEKREFISELSNIPVGGPYDIELRVRNGRKNIDTLTVDDIYVGDVWILAGQSNMQGHGNLVDAPKPHPMVRAFYMRDEWGVADEPIHFLEEAVDLFHNGYGDGPERPSKARLNTMRKRCLKGVSPALYFGIEMYKRTRIPQGFIACAHGGTSMAQWSPELKNDGGGSLYGAMLRRFNKLGQPVAGVLWYQGESDANQQTDDVYTEKMIELVNETRSDMNIPKLPWVIVQLGRHIAEDDTHWNSIQEQQRLLPEKIKYLDVVPAIDLELDDGIHISGTDQGILGKRLARVADRLVNGNPKAKPGIKLKSIEVSMKRVADGEPTNSIIELKYSNVAGKLESKGRPTGFTLLDKEGKVIRGIFKTVLKGNSILLKSNIIPKNMKKFTLSYGHGRAPYCNITDQEGMAIPVMSNISLI